MLANKTFQFNESPNIRSDNSLNIILRICFRYRNQMVKTKGIYMAKSHDSLMIQTSTALQQNLFICIDLFMKCVPQNLQTY